MLNLLNAILRTAQLLQSTMKKKMKRRPPLLVIFDIAIIINPKEYLTNNKSE